MSTADDAWQEWAEQTPLKYDTEGPVHFGFVAGYRRALEDAADAINEGRVTWGDGPGGYYGAMVDHVPLDAWIANRAAAVGTKDGDDEIEVPCLSCNDDPNVDCPMGCGRR